MAHYGFEHVLILQLDKSLERGAASGLLRISLFTDVRCLRRCQRQSKPDLKASVQNMTYENNGLTGRRRCIFEFQNFRRHTEPDGCLRAIAKCARIDQRSLHQTFVHAGDAKTDPIFAKQRPTSPA